MNNFFNWYKFCLNKKNVICEVIEETEIKQFISRYSKILFKLKLNCSVSYVTVYKYIVFYRF